MAPAWALTSAWGRPLDWRRARVVRTKAPRQDELPPASLLARRHELGLRRALVDAWNLVLAQVDLAALEHAAARHAELDLDRLLLPDLLDELVARAMTGRLGLAFTRGAEFGADQLRAVGVPLELQKAAGAAKPVVSVQFGAVNEEAVRWARERALANRRRFSADQRTVVREVLAAGLEEGIGADEMARRIRVVIGLRSDQVQAIARFRERLRDRGLPDADVSRRAGRYADGQRLKRAKMVARTECLPTETLVHEAVVGAALRRWYEGQMVEVWTCGGRKFSATPNHPMLTRRGWVPAGQLQQGDNLIRDCRQQHVHAPTDPHVAARPASLGEIFGAIQDVGVLERRVGHPDDFHGDGQEREVYILRPDRLLRYGHFAALYQPLAHDILSDADKKWAAPLCPSCGRLLSVDQQPCLCDGAERDTMLTQDALDRLVGYAERFGDRCWGLAARVARDNERCWQIGIQHGRTATTVEEFPAGLLGASNCYAALAQLGSDPAGIGVQPLRHERDTEALAIECDRVIDVRVRAWSGHVFNLSTPYGYYTVNGGLYTGNTIGAINAGQMALWRQAIQQGAIREGALRKKWLVTLDERLEARCEALGEADPIEIDALFGGEVEAPPLHPNCRCAVGLVKAPPSIIAARPVSDTLREVFGKAPHFDGGARRMMRQSEGLWDFLEELQGRRGPEADRLKEFVDRVAMLVHDEIGDPSRNLGIGGVALDQIGLDRGGFSGEYRKATATIALSHATTDGLRQLLREGSPRSTWRLPNLLTAVETVVHESVHHANIGRYMTQDDVFLEEGITELYARRWTLALTYGGNARERRKGRAMWRKVGAYAEYVREMSWFERTFGSSTMRTVATARDRTGALGAIMPTWWSRVLRAHRDPQVRAHAAEISRAIAEEARRDQFFVTRWLRQGHWRGMARWTWADFGANGLLPFLFGS